MVNRKELLLAILLSSLLFAGCGGQTSLAPISKHVRASKHSSATIHTVHRGETLYSIAFQYGKDYRTLARWNKIRSPYTIFVGQKIRLRGSKKHLARHAKSSKSTQVTSKTSRSTIKRSPNKLKKNKKTVKKTSKIASSRGLVKGKIYWQWPVNGLIIKKFKRNSPTQKGIDVSGRLGQTIKATAAGRIVYSGSGLRGYGRLIIVKHNERFLSAYAHNRKLFVKEGQTVKQGQKIAEMGRSGTDRVKLHFEIRSDGNPVDPLRYLPKRPR